MYIPENVNINCGIYRIVNTRTGKFYIGSTKNAKRREKQHFKALVAKIHNNQYLQNAWNAEENKSVFKFQMFIYCNENYLIKLEQGCIDNMNPDYNLNKVAGIPPSAKGKKRSLETIEKLKKSLNRPEIKAKFSGPMSVEARINMSAARRAMGDNHPSKRLEVRAKISESRKALGDNHPSKRPDVREKISKNSATRRPEVREKMRQAQLNSCLTEEQRRARALKGAETKRKNKLRLHAEAALLLDWPSKGYSNQYANALLIGYLL